MTGTLTQDEANKLINMLKRTVEERIVFPNQKGSLSFSVIGERENNKFVVNIDRKGRKAEKCTYQGRVYQSNQILMRLDIDPNGRHTNPDGEIIRGNHLHIYHELYDMRFATPFDINDTDLYNTCYTFFEKFNIIQPPTVFYHEIMDI